MRYLTAFLLLCSTAQAEQVDLFHFTIEGPINRVQSNQPSSCFQVGDQIRIEADMPLGSESRRNIRHTNGSAALYINDVMIAENDFRPGGGIQSYPPQRSRGFQGGGPTGYVDLVGGGGTLAEITLIDQRCLGWAEVAWTPAPPTKGDANRNGLFDSGDLVEVFIAGLYESGQPAMWTEGDWNDDRKFDSGDLVAAFSDGGYSSGAKAVPEPSAVFLAILGACLTYRRKNS